MYSVDWQRLRLVIFDVDGTLYDLTCLRTKMIGELARHCLRRPGDWRLLRQIAEFRRSREKLADAEALGIGVLQYSEPARKLGIPSESLQNTVRTWFLERPLPHLRQCRFSSVEKFFDKVRSADKKIAVLSDYPARAKLRALGLEADLFAAAVDPDVDRLKPHPAGLLRLLDLAQVAAQEALLIGDRDHRDGECARRANVPYLLKSPRPDPAARRFADYGELLSWERRDAAGNGLVE